MVWEGRVAREGGGGWGVEWPHGGGHRGDMEGIRGGCGWQRLATHFHRWATSACNSVGVLGGFCGCEATRPASFIGAGVGMGLGGETLGGVVLVLACRQKWMSMLLW